MPKKVGLAGAVLAALTLVGVEATATTHQTWPLAKTVEHTAAVVEGTVTGSRDVNDEFGPARVYDVEVQAVYRGTATPKLTLRFAGGKLKDGRTVEVVGMPRLDEGSRYVFFLPNDKYPWSGCPIAANNGLLQVVKSDDGRLALLDPANGWVTGTNQAGEFVYLASGGSKTLPETSLPSPDQFLGVALSEAEAKFGAVVSGKFSETPLRHPFGGDVAPPGASESKGEVLQ